MFHYKLYFIVEHVLEIGSKKQLFRRALDIQMVVPPLTLLLLIRNRKCVERWSGDLNGTTGRGYRTWKKWTRLMRYGGFPSHGSDTTLIIIAFQLQIHRGATHTVMKMVNGYDMVATLGWPLQISQEDTVGATCRQFELKQMLRPMRFGTSWPSRWADEACGVDLDHGLPLEGIMFFFIEQNLFQNLTHW